MSRILKELEIEGKPAVALFDTGAYLSYVRRELIAEVPKRTLPKPYRVGLGGNSIEVREVCVAIASIEGLSFDVEVVPVDELGKVDGRPLDAVIGALVMEKWEIKLDPRGGTLDLEGLRRREFTEFWASGVRSRAKQARSPSWRLSYRLMTGLTGTSSGHSSGDRSNAPNAEGISQM